MRCASCGGAAHPASGHAHSEKTMICGRCARSFMEFVKAQMKRKFRVGPRGSGDYIGFYEFVVPRGG